jgi:hypothetical protein
MKEVEILNQIMTYLEGTSYGFFWRTPNTHTRNRTPKGYRKGIPDILGCLSDGRLCGIEVKTDIGHLSDSQLDFQIEVSKRSAYYIIARSLEDVVIALRSIKKERMHVNSLDS